MSSTGAGSGAGAWQGRGGGDWRIRSYNQWATERYGQGHDGQRSVYNNTDMAEAYRAGSIYGTGAPMDEVAAYDAFVKDYWPAGKEWYRDPKNVGGSDFRSFFIGGYVAALDLAAGSFDEWLSKTISDGVFSPTGDPSHTVIVTAAERRLLRKAYMAGLRRAVTGKYVEFTEWRSIPPINGAITVLRERLGAVGLDSLESLLVRAFTAGGEHACDASEELCNSEDSHIELVNTLLAEAPGTYDRDESQESILLRYVRDLEELRDSIVRGIPKAIFMVLGDPNFDSEAFYRAVQVQRGVGREDTEGLDGVPEK